VEKRKKKWEGIISSCLNFVLNFPPPSSAFSDFSFVERKERGKKEAKKSWGE
jgi:hypothetical protein